MKSLSRDDSSSAVLDTIKSRRSCRLFSDEGLSKATIGKILDAANDAPSPMNCQPWEFIVLTGESLAAYRSAVSEWLKVPEERASDGTLIAADILPDGDFSGALPKVLVERKRAHLRHLSDELAKIGITLKDVYASTYYGHNAPVIVLVVTYRVKRDRNGLEVHQAVAAAIQNILLAAQALGYGSCWIGDILRFERRLTEYLGLDENREIVAAVTLGHPNPNNPVRMPKKTPVDDRVDWRGF
jgi:nitroreductase